MRAIVLIASLLSAVVAHAAPPQPGFFPVSVWYAGGKARAPMLEPVTPQSAAEWREDLSRIKSLGFNTVRTWVEWTSGEPREGQYHFEQLDLMLRLAQEMGLRVFVQVYVDSAPDWVGEKFPDGKFVAQNGAAIPSQAAPGYCFDHPGVRQAVLKFFREAARHAARSPAFYGWDLWSEPHIINWAEINYIPNATFCYCPHSQARFREWLRGKYGSLDALNKAWYRQFHDWKQVEPPRFDTILSYTDFMDWRIFITEKLAADLAARSQTVKEILPGAVATSHSAAPSALGSLAGGDGNPDDWLMHKSVDYYGCSLYPKHSLPPHWSVTRLTVAMDLERSAGGNRGFYVGELQGGFGVRGDVISEEITPLDLLKYMWAAVSRAARGINIYAFYPMNSGYESGGYGLINLDGTLTERSRTAGRTARQIHEHSDLILASRPQPAEAAIVVNQWTTLIGGQSHLYNRGAVARSLSGYYRMFSERNVPVDFLSAREVTAAQLRPYKLVVVPYPILLLTNEARALEQYVREGGHLFTEARAGWVDERGYAQAVVPGFGWDRMLGVREKSVTPKSETRVKWGSDEFAGAIFEERFTVLDVALASRRPAPSSEPPPERATPVATFDDGSPAAYEHRHGQGAALILGTFAGQVNDTRPVSPHPLGGLLCRWAGLALPDLKASSPVDFKQLVAPAGRLLFLLNWGASASKVELDVRLDKPARQVREIISGEAIPGGSSTLGIRAEVPPQSARVYRIDY